MDKVKDSPEAAVADIPDGSTIAIAGFGVSHRFPSSLIVAMRDQGARNLQIVCNSLGSPGELRGNILAENKQINRIIASFTARPGIDSALGQQIAAGDITYELVPQGTLVERLRAAGAGLAGIYTPTGVGTVIAEGKETREFDGVTYLFERSLPVDYAFVRAAVGDRAGNLRFHGTSQNFNPSFAKAAKVAIAEVDEIVEVGEIDPDDVELPGIFVARVVKSTIKIGVGEMKASRKRPAESGREYNGKPALTRAQLAQRAAALLPEGSSCNLGAGLPSLIGDYLEGRDVTLHAENGVIGFGGALSSEQLDPDVYNAGGIYVSVRPGGAFFDSVTSFEMVRGGKVDTVVLGAFQVARNGDLANWTTPEMIGGGIGGAMDLVTGCAQVIVTMEHLDSKGRAKLVDHCTYPLTGKACVDVLVTDLALLRRENEGFVLVEVAPGFTPQEIVELTEMPISVARDVKTIELD